VSVPLTVSVVSAGKLLVEVAKESKETVEPASIVIWVILVWKSVGVITPLLIVAVLLKVSS